MWRVRSANCYIRVTFTLLYFLMLLWTTVMLHLCSFCNRRNINSQVMMTMLQATMSTALFQRVTCVQRLDFIVLVAAAETDTRDEISDTSVCLRALFSKHRRRVIIRSPHNTRTHVLTHYSPVHRSQSPIFVDDCFTHLSDVINHYVITQCCVH